jgi:hypothetical protein
VTAAATRAAGPAPEILGISGVEESGQFVDVTNMPSSLLWANPPANTAYNWPQPKYVLDATTLYNSSPNPYFINLVTNSLDPQAVYNSNGRQGLGAGPDAALAAYDTVNGDPTDNAIWALLPDIIIGNNAGAANASYATSATAVGGSSYQPTSLTYSFQTNAGLITTMYSIAAAGDAKVTTTKSLRYGSATDIAKDYERYIRGTQGYILSQLPVDEDTDLPIEKTVAVVIGYASGTYTLALPGTPSGTASTNRYLETVENVANNYANTVGSTVSSATLVAAVTSGAIDLVIVGGQGLTPDQNTITNQLSTDGVPLVKTYYTYAGTAATPGTAAMYGVIMNSVENAQNIGRILGVLYPNIVDQSDYIAYYFDNFYHINSATLNDALTYSLANTVPNYNNLGSVSTRYGWATADVSSYNKAAVQLQLTNGITWLLAPANAGNYPAALIPTPNLP